MATTSSCLVFPPSFRWGTATASYQIEGGWNEGGRAMSIWDAFSKTPGKVFQGHTGDKAVDHYHLYKEDVALMKSMGLKNYRFSISWSRVIPAGIGAVNEEGVAFYSDLINELLKNGIEPIVTLYHWDLPLALEMEFSGWLGNEHIVDAFEAYSKVCFERFGDRVKHWITLNEPWCTAMLGFGNGEFAPGRKHAGKTEVYTVAHNMLLAHAKAIHLYRTQYKLKQKGEIGITLNCDWREPKPSTDANTFKQNEEAAERSILYFLGWFSDPVYFGDYPTVMKERLGNRLPKFTDEEKKLLKQSSDFFGLNHYGTAYAEPSEQYVANIIPGHTGSIWEDAGVKQSDDPNWQKTVMGWNVVPSGFNKMLKWIQKRYNPVGGIIVTENGCADKEEDVEKAVVDTFRVNFLKGYITAMHEAIQDGVDVRGYFAWSFVDNFEWAWGYSYRFGLHYVNYKTMERVPKQSAKWYKKVIESNSVEQA